MFTEPNEEEKVNQNNAIIQIELEKVASNPYFVGFDFAEQNLQDEADKIKNDGMLINPILVVHAQEQKYIVAKGEKLYRAALLANIVFVPIVIVNYTPEEVEQAALLEMLTLKDLHISQELRCYDQLLNVHKLSIAEVAKTIDKAVSTIVSKMRLLNLPQDVLRQLQAPQFKEGHAQALLKLNGTDFQEGVIARILQKNYTVKQTEEFVSAVLAKGTVEINDPKPPLRFVIKDARIIMSTLKKAIADVQKNIGVDIELTEEQCGDDLLLTVRVPNKRSK